MSVQLSRVTGVTNVRSRVLCKKKTVFMVSDEEFATYKKPVPVLETAKLVKVNVVTSLTLKR